MHRHCVFRPFSSDPPTLSILQALPPIFDNILILTMVVKLLVNMYARLFSSLVISSLLEKSRQFPYLE
jgi:hypothetical protein